MNTFQAQRRQPRSHRAVVLALVVAVNAGIAGFIDRLATGGAPAEMVLTKPAALARA